MSDKKTISINTAFFKQGGRSKSSNQTSSRKPKPLSIISPNDLKRNLIKKVKEHQNNLQKSYNDDTNTKIENSNYQKEDNTSSNRFFPDEFRESLDYLVQLSKEHKEHKEQNTDNKIKLHENTIVSNNNRFNKDMNNFYNTPSNFQLEQVDVELPKSLIEKNIDSNITSNISSHNNISLQDKNTEEKGDYIEKDKPYGCLKNGLKPTYRTYMKTRKNKLNTHPSDHMKQFVQSQNNNISKPNNIKKKEIKYVTKQIKTRRFKCGKNKNTRKVGIVLKSGKMRSKVLAEKQTIKSRPYAQMKNELYKKGFLKIGTNAPKDLVTVIYENSILAGDVLNKNKDVLIHNYMNDSESKY